MKLNKEALIAMLVTFVVVFLAITAHAKASRKFPMLA